MAINLVFVQQTTYRFSFSYRQADACSEHAENLHSRYCALLGHLHTALLIAVCEITQHAACLLHDMKCEGAE